MDRSYFYAVKSLPARVRLKRWLYLNIYLFIRLFVEAQMGVAPKYLRDAIRLPTFATSLRPLRSMDRRELLSLGLGQPWPCLDLLPLLPLLFGIASSARASFLSSNLSTSLSLLKACLLSWS